MSKDEQEALVQSSWDWIASILESGSPSKAEFIRALLRDSDPAWRRQEVSLIVELSGFAYGKLIDAAREIAASRRDGRPVTDQMVDSLRVADDVLSTVRELFELCEPEHVVLHPSLN